MISKIHIINNNIHIIYNMRTCYVYILTFIITALWDIVLRKMSENYDSLPKFLQFDFVKYLQPYFKQHTLLAAALIAGFIGATTQVIILNVHTLPTDKKSFITFIIASFIISSIYGFVIKFSQLFPYLVETYYKHLGVPRSMYLDGVSGVIVQLTLLTSIYIWQRM